MKNTHGERWERQMMVTPHEIPRGGGNTILNRFRYKPEDVDCQYCTEYRYKQCTNPRCLWLQERLEAGAVSYQMLVMESFQTLQDYVLVNRIHEVVFGRCTIHMQGFLHKQRLSFWKSYLAQRNRQSIDFDQLAILYLLTAWENLWNLSQPYLVDVVNTGNSDFIPCNAESPENMLLKTIRSIIGKRNGITPEELKDKELVSDDTLRLIVDAALICRYGHTIFLLKEQDDIK